MLDLGPPRALLSAARRLPAAAGRGMRGFSPAASCCRPAGAREPSRCTAACAGLRAHGRRGRHFGESPFLARGQPVRLPCTLARVHDGVVPERRSPGCSGSRPLERGAGPSRGGGRRGRVEPSGRLGPWARGRHRRADVAGLARRGLRPRRSRDARRRKVERGGPYARPSRASGRARARRGALIRRSRSPSMPTTRATLCACEAVNRRPCARRCGLGADGPKPGEAFHPCGMGPLPGPDVRQRLTRLVAGRGKAAPARRRRRAGIRCRSRPLLLAPNYPRRGGQP